MISLTSLFYYVQLGFAFFFLLFFENAHAIRFTPLMVRMCLYRKSPGGEDFVAVEFK